MKLLFVTLAASSLIAFMSPACLAQTVIKCTSKIGVLYQATPCAEDAVSVVVVPSPAIIDSAPVLGPVAGPAPPAQATSTPATAAPQALAPTTDAEVLAKPAKRQKLSAGISDMHVLNHRHWGKPQRITRNRELRAWHETWNYEKGENAGTQLHFINGRLAEIADPEITTPRASSVSVAIVVDE